MRAAESEEFRNDEVPEAKKDNQQQRKNMIPPSAKQGAKPAQTSAKAAAAPAAPSAPAKTATAAADEEDYEFVEEDDDY